MNPKSAIEKGKRLEKFLREYFVKNLDQYAVRTAGSGNGLDKSDLNLPQWNIKVSAKNHKSVSLSEWWEECKGYCFNEIPVLAIRNPRKAEFEEVLIVMGLDQFTEMLKNTKEETTVNATLDYSQRNLINNGIRALKAILNNWDK